MTDTAPAAQKQAHDPKWWTLVAVCTGVFMLLLDITIVNVALFDIQADLEPRRTGTSPFTSQRQEPDRVKILSGVFEGRTTGTAIGLIVENVDARGRDYERIKDRFRPGHADYAYQQKYGIRDHRGGGRASGAGLAGCDRVRAEPRCRCDRHL